MKWWLLMLAATPDGGTLSAPAPAAAVKKPSLVSVADAGVAHEPPRASAEVARLRNEVGQLRESNARLSEKVESVSRDLDAKSRELEAMRTQLAEQQRAAREGQQQAQAARERVEASQRAAVSFGALDQQLLTGDTAAFEATLRNAEPSLGPSARANLQQARLAIANGDLTNARTYLFRAATDAQAGR